MSDLVVLAQTATFVLSSWLLLVVCDRLMGGKP